MKKPIIVILIIIGALIVGAGAYLYYQKTKIQTEEDIKIAKKPGCAEIIAELFNVKLVNGFVNLNETKCKDNLYIQPYLYSPMYNPDAFIPVNPDGEFYNLKISTKKPEAFLLVQQTQTEGPPEKQFSPCLAAFSFPEMDEIIFDAESSAMFFLGIDYVYDTLILETEKLKETIKKDPCFQKLVQFFKFNLPIIYLEEILKKEELWDLTDACVKQDESLKNRKLKDSRIISAISQLRAIAEMIHVKTGSYEVFCDDDNKEANILKADLNENIPANGKVLCFSDKNNYCVSATLYEGNNFCIKTGESKIGTACVSPDKGCDDIE